MRVLIAPGSFGSLSAVAAAEAVAEGWARQAPADELVLTPVCDAGAGFVDVLQASLDGEIVAVDATDAYGEPIAATILVVGDTAYVEAAQVCSARPGRAPDGEQASSLALGRLVASAAETGIRRIVVGVGVAGLDVNDGGAGLLAGLGATSLPPGALSQGSPGLELLTGVGLSAALHQVARVELELATDDDTPLLGLLGTTNTAGVGRGIAADRLPLVDRHIEHLADLVGRRQGLTKGAGAGGGIGFALLVVGGVRVGGFAAVSEAVGLSVFATDVDLVVTGEEVLDPAAGSGLISARVAGVASAAIRPCIALAMRVLVGARETRSMGIESAYAASDLPAAGDGTPDTAADLARLAERVARTWSWSR